KTGMSETRMPKPGTAKTRAPKGRAPKASASGTRTSKTKKSKARTLKKSLSKKQASRSRGRTSSGTSPDLDLKELKHRLLEISDLAAAGAVLGWDHATYMPKGGADARARQGATISRITHEKGTDPALGRLLDRLAAHGEALPYDSDDASLIRVTRRDF